MSEPSILPVKVTPIATAMTTMVLAMLIVPGMDVLAKLLSSVHDVGPVTIVWIRFWGQAILLATVIMFVLGVRGLGGNSKVMNLVRGGLVGSAVSLFFIAIKYLPLADAIAIFFVEPLIVMILSALFLGEKIGWRRSLAALFGFAGAMMIVQPSYEVFGLKALLPLGTAVLFSIYLILSRMVGQSDHPLTMQFWSGVGGGLICTLFMALGGGFGLEDVAFKLPVSETIIWLLAGVVVIATASHLMIVIAFTKAPASILAPFQYLEIVTMTIAGFLVFGDFPDTWRWVGIAMIISSGLYIFLRERQLEHEPQDRPGSPETLS